MTPPFGPPAHSTADEAAETVVKIILFAAIMLIGWFVAHLVALLAERLLARLGTDRFAERTGIRRLTGDYRPSRLLGQSLFYALLLLLLLLAFSVFGPNPVSRVLYSIVAWLARLLIALVIVLIAVVIGNAFFDVIRNALAALPYGRLLARIAQITVIALGAIAALDEIGVAAAVTGPVLVAVLATVGGTVIVGVGGGLVRPMSERWERVLTRAEREGARAAAHLRKAAEARRASTQPSGAGPASAESPGGRQYGGGPPGFGPPGDGPPGDGAPDDGPPGDGPPDDGPPGFGPPDDRPPTAGPPGDAPPGPAPREPAT
jgi:Conserved TM helix